MSIKLMHYPRVVHHNATDLGLASIFMQKPSPVRFILGSALLLISLSAITWAQVDSTSLTGTVTDQQDKRIPHAKVRAIQAATGLQRETETTSQGDYEFVDLPAGTFTVQISKDGFSTFQADRVVQMVGQTSDLPSEDVPCPGSGSWMARNAHFVKSSV